MKQRKRLSIKWKIFAYLLGFTVFLLIMLWFFQIVNLSTFYEYFRTKEIKDMTMEIAEHVDDDEFDKYVAGYMKEYDISVNFVDGEGKSLLPMPISEQSHVYISDSKVLSDMLLEAKQQDEIMILEVEGKNKNDVPPPDAPDVPFEKHIKDAKSVVCILDASSADDERYLLVSALITPVDATVNTLQVQFIYISIIFFVLAILIALIISGIVSRPIVRINSSAKELAKGHFDTEFKEDGYREIQELSKTLNYTARELGKTEELQKDLLANVSHDLRTPLTMITAYSEVMRDIPGENSPENIQVIIDEATRLTTLVNDLLDLSKLQSGVAEIKKEVFDITQNIKAILERFSKLTEQDGYTILFEYRDNVMVFADEYKVYQVIYNLIINAINYSGEDKTVVVRQIVHGNVVRIEIEDHGNGIAKDELDNIWDRYYKVDKNHKRAVQGTGLGLSIVQNILELHGARYGVNSTIGKGSIFWFELN